jgi:peptidyl-prolyl cis-trans isomerase D
MLEAIMKTMGKYVVGAIAVFLAFVFALQFGGPQAEGCTTGGARSVVAAEVYGQKITLGEYRASSVMLGVDRQDEVERRANRMDQAVLDGLVDRALLAREARKLGLHVSEEDALAKMLDTRSVRASIGTSAPSSYRSGGVEVQFLPKDEKLEEDFVKNAIQNRTRRSVSEFAKGQAEELVAERMRDVIRSSVRVSPAEVWETYVAETDKADLDYVRFSAAHYRDALTFTPAEIDAWIAANAAAVDKAYEAEKHRYTGLDKQVRARQILVELAAEDDASKAAAKTEAEALARKAKAGADFAALASASSDDEDTKAKGGDLGYTPVGRRPEPFDATVFALKAGDVSDAVEGPGGYYVFKAESFREGDVPVDEAKREIAERLLRDEKAGGAAKAAAEKALARLQAGVAFEALDRELAGLRPLKAGESAPEDEKDPREGKDSAPRHESTGSFGRGDSPLGPSSAELTKIAFALTEADALAKAPIQIGSDYVVYRLKTRETATEEGFTAETKARINEELRLAKGDEAVRLYVANLRDRAKKENELVVDIEAVRAPVGDGPNG